MLRLRGETPELAGPCGPDPWYLEVGTGEDPVEVVARLAGSLMGPPTLVHSTSWRRARGGVVLTFLIVNADDQAPELPGLPLRRAELARSGATRAAREISTDQVLEHALRHLAWLATDDPAVRAALDGRWRSLLADYVPEPFRHIG